jgi:hypothetical protein
MRAMLDDNPEDFDEEELEALEAIADGLMVEVDSGEIRELFEKVDGTDVARVIPGQRALFEFPLSPDEKPPGLDNLFDRLSERV